MGFGELIARLFSQLEPLVPGVITVVVATVAAMLYLYLVGRFAWLKNNHFSLASIFFGLDTVGVIHISCAWLKLIFPIVYIVSFQKLVLIQYLMILVPGIVLIFLAGSVGKAVGSLFNLVLEMGGIVSASLICGYIREMHAGIGFKLVYGAIGIFMVLFVVYLFLQDLERISMSRKVEAERIWGITDDEIE